MTNLPDGRREEMAEELRLQLRLYTLPPNVATYLAPADNHDSVSSRCSEVIADALAPMLAGWLAEAASCQCPPCPGRGNDGHRMTHCAECCFGTGVEADPECPTHGEGAMRAARDAYQRGRRDLAAKVEALAEEWDDFEHDAAACLKFDCGDCVMVNAIYDLRKVLADALLQEGHEEPATGPLAAPEGGSGRDHASRVRARGGDEG